MSWQASEWALKQDAGRPGAQLVLHVLAVHAKPEGVTFAGRKTIAAECLLNKSTVSQHLELLERRRLIARVEAYDAKGSRTNDWIILAPCWADRGEMEDDHPERDRAKGEHDHPADVLERAGTEPDGPVEARDENAPQVGKADPSTGRESRPVPGPQVGFPEGTGRVFGDHRSAFQTPQVGKTGRRKPLRETPKRNTEEKHSRSRAESVSENTSTSGDPHRPDKTNSSTEEKHTSSRTGMTVNPELHAAALAIIDERGTIPADQLEAALEARHGDTLPFTDGELRYTLTKSDQALRVADGWTLTDAAPPEPPAPRAETPVRDPETLARAIAAAITPEHPR